MGASEGTTATLKLQRCCLSPEAHAQSAARCGTDASKPEACRGAALGLNHDPSWGDPSSPGLTVAWVDAVGVAALAGVKERLEVAGDIEARDHRAVVPRFERGRLTLELC